MFVQALVTRKQSQQFIIAPVTTPNYSNLGLI